MDNNNKLRWFEKLIRINTIKIIAFWLFFMVSAFLSVNLYINLAESNLEKGIMVAVSLALELLKIYSLVVANTSLYIATMYKLKYIKEYIQGLFGMFFPIKRIKNPEIVSVRMRRSKKLRTARGLYVLYVGLASLSVAATFGFILVTVEKASRASIVVDNTDKISAELTKIESRNRIIADNDKVIESYNQSIAILDPADPNTSWKRANIETRLKPYKESNQKLLNEIEVINSIILALKDEQTSKQLETKKTMYQLIGDTLGVSDRYVMFVLLILLAIGIEIGIVTTSPHMNVNEDDEDYKNLVNFVSRLDYTSVNKAAEKKVNEEETPIEKPAKEYSLPVVKSTKEMAVTKKEPIIEKENKEPVDIPVPETPILEEKAKKIEKTKSSSTKEEDYIKALFDNSGHSYLRDKMEAADMIGLPRINAVGIFDKLSRIKGDSGYSLIEFRRETGYWHPNYTSEYIINHIKKLSENTGA